MDTIILYSQQGCPQCRMIHMLLDRQGIKYDECQDADQMHALGIQHTPVLSVNGILLSGTQIKDYIHDGTLPISDSCSSCEVK